MLIVVVVFFNRQRCFATGAIVRLDRPRRLRRLQGSKRLLAAQSKRLGKQGLLQEQEQNSGHYIKEGDKCCD